MHVLAISPIPSHPQNQGNTARILHLGRALQLLGATIHFVYVQLEGLDSEMRQGMETCWDNFDTLPLTRQLRPSAAGHFLLDDWYETELDRLLRDLFERVHFDVMLVNYVWFSRAFLNAPASCFKVLDTHDVFGDRHKRLLAHGVAPAWYFTTPEEEARGLARADCVLAIQGDEANDFRQLVDVPVHVLGHLMPSRRLAPRRNSGQLRVGYVGSSNPTNVDSMRKLSKAMMGRTGLTERFRFLIAGPICDCEIHDDGMFERLGRLNDMQELYGNVDLLLNPNVGGSGLKIKSVEALSFGLPIVATIDAMLGIDTDCPEHRCIDAEAICDILQGLGGLDDLARMAKASQEIFHRYQASQFDQLEKIFSVGAVDHAAKHA